MQSLYLRNTHLHLSSLFPQSFSNSSSLSRKLLSLKMATPLPLSEITQSLELRPENPGSPPMTKISPQRARQWLHQRAKFALCPEDNSRHGESREGPSIRGIVAESPSGGACETRARVSESLPPSWDPEKCPVRSFSGYSKTREVCDSLCAHWSARTAFPALNPFFEAEFFYNLCLFLLFSLSSNT